MPSRGAPKWPKIRAQPARAFQHDGGRHHPQGGVGRPSAVAKLRSDHVARVNGRPKDSMPTNWPASSASTGSWPNRRQKDRSREPQHAPSSAARRWRSPTGPSGAPPAHRARSSAARHQLGDHGRNGRRRGRCRPSRRNSRWCCRWRRRPAPCLLKRPSRTTSVVMIAIWASWVQDQRRGEADQGARLGGPDGPVGAGKRGRGRKGGHGGHGCLRKGKDGAPDKKNPPERGGLGRAERAWTKKGVRLGGDLLASVDEGGKRSHGSARV